MSSKQSFADIVRRSVNTTLEQSVTKISPTLQNIGVPKQYITPTTVSLGVGGLSMMMYLVLKQLKSLLTFPPKPTIENKDYDIVIIGGGIAGCALGSAFSKQNKKVLIIEQSLKEPDRIVGELLQPGGVESLKELGLEECLEGMNASDVTGYAVFYNGEVVHLPYPSDEKTGEQRKGKSFHYGKFIMNLRRAAEKDGAKLIEGSVTELIEERKGLIEGVKYRDLNTKEDKTISAHLTIVCNGAGSSFTKELRSASTKPLVVSHFIGLELQDCADKLPYPQRGNVFLLPSAPCLAYPNSTTSVRCLIDYPDGNKLPNKGEEMSKYLLEYVMPHLPENLHSAFTEEVVNGRIKCVPNRELPGEQSSSLTKKGVVLIGDAMNCRHPLTGGGMTVTFSDCKILADTLQNVDLRNYTSVSKALDQFYILRTKTASTINILANALYNIFAPPTGAAQWENFKRGETKVTTLSENDGLSLMRQSVFEYFKKGGICATGPVSLLGGVLRSPTMLILHFFAVAFVGCYDILRKTKSVLGLFTSFANCFRLVSSATRLIGPLIAEEHMLKFLFPSIIFNRGLGTHQKKD
ncbi:hypothetical protein ABK040_008153 [Willaertia magna]